MKRMENLRDIRKLGRLALVKTDDRVDTGRAQPARSDDTPRFLEEGGQSALNDLQKLVADDHEIVRRGIILSAGLGDLSGGGYRPRGGPTPL